MKVLIQFFVCFAFIVMIMVNYYHAPGCMYFSKQLGTLIVVPLCKGAGPELVGWCPRWD